MSRPDPQSTGPVCDVVSVLPSGGDTMLVVCRGCRTVELTATPSAAQVVLQAHRRITVLNQAAMGGVLFNSDGESHEDAMLALKVRMQAGGRR